jgi:nucleoside-diphosphate-sugar epimerase
MQNGNPMLKGKKVLVTGAPGFIGCRLVEKLMLEQGADVRALVHKFNRAARLARFPVEMCPGGLADADAIDKAVAGCDVVFNCAHDWVMAKDNLKGIQILTDACLRHGVRRLVHLSTFATYQPLPDGDLDEERPTEPDGWAYKDTKIAIERELLRSFKERNLPVVVLLPTVVYGPYARSWIDLPVQNLLNGTVVLPDNGQGWCNGVYIDDMVDAMILAAVRDEALGERILISGPDEATWAEYFGALQDVLGVDSLKYWSDDQIHQSKKDFLKNAKLFLREPKRFVKLLPIRKPLEFIYQRLGDKAKQQALKIWRFKRQSGEPELFLPDEEQFLLYKARTRVSIAKAKRLLGYEPAFPFARGMALTKDYVRWAYPTAR